MQFDKEEILDGFESIVSPLSEQKPIIIKVEKEKLIEKSMENINPLNEIKKKHEEIMKNVPNVVREYLHLTATVAKLKYPNVNISSEELIQKVKDLSFIDYYDHMIRIMKNEDSKLRKLEYEQQQEILNRQRSKSMGINLLEADHNKNNGRERQSSFFSKFAKLFSGGSSPTEKPKSTSAVIRTTSIELSDDVNAIIKEALPTHNSMAHLSKMEK